ncbi:MAG: transposase [Sandaracinaceae bacterium]|jgi:transposase|nr:transposase [Sandaracinaceae bacterium]
MLLTTRERLRPDERAALRHMLLSYPELRELYEAKEAMHTFYRIKGRARAGRAFANLVDRLATSALPELQTLRKTLLRWRRAILEYFLCGYTNGRVEGFNLKAKLVKRRAYGYRSFRNYRLRLLNACA